jgi:hypothetical protein
MLSSQTTNCKLPSWAIQSWRHTLDQNSRTKQPTKLYRQERLAKAQEPWQKISFNKPREVIRTTMKDFSAFPSGSSFHNLNRKWQKKQAKRSYYKHGYCNKRSSYKQWSHRQNKDKATLSTGQLQASRIKQDPEDKGKQQQRVRTRDRTTFVRV